MSYGGWIGYFVILLAGSVFSSIANIALHMLSEVKIQEVLNWSSKEKTINDLESNVEKLILTTSVCRLIFNISIFIGIYELIGKLGMTVTYRYVTVFFSAAVILGLFSVAIPYAWAKYSGEAILGKCCRLLRPLSLLMWPVLYLFDLNDRIVRRLAGVVEISQKEQQEEKQEEFLTGLEQRRIEGVVDEEEQEMIENVLELSETTSDKIMTPRTDIVAVEAHCGLAEALKIVTQAGHSRVPVYEENIDNIIGFLYAKDLLAEIGKEESDFNLRSKLRKAYFVPETKLLRSLLHEFQNRKFHIAVVLDEYGGTAGIVTIEDVLEELVGEITDEYEQTQPETVKQIDPDTIEVDARMYVDDANDQFDLGLPEDDDYDTIGGFVFSHLGYIPKASEQFEYKNLLFIIVSAETRKIKRIRISKLMEQQDAQ